MSENNATECTPCAQGFYQDVVGKQECKACLVHQATLLLGATGAHECKCVEGYYREDPSSPCVPCKKGMSCPFGSEMSQYWDWHRAGRSESTQKDFMFPMVESRYTSDGSLPLSIFLCKSSDRCPGGPPGTCGPNLLTDVGSCAHCEEKWFWDGEKCAECTDFEASSVLFPIIPLILGPMVVCFIYRLFRDDPEKWGSWQNGGAAIVFILLNHFQITTLASSANIQFPDSIDSWFGAWAFSDDMISIFKPECAGFASLEKSMITRSLGPVIMAVIFVLVFACSQLVKNVSGQPVAMDQDRTLNIYFSIILTFFAGIVSMCITIFKCHDNPNGKWTLSRDESVICYEDKWSSMLALACISCIVYILGFGALCVYIITVAPHRFQEVSFQRRWKFLFIKYRPDVWWWTIAFCLKSFLMNIGFIFLDTGIAQMLWILAVCAIYAGHAMYWNPWRHRNANFAEVYGHMVLLAVLAILVWYSYESAEDPDTIGKELSVCLILVNAHFLVVAILLVLEQYLQKPASASATHNFLEGIKEISKLSNEDVNVLVNHLSEWDRYYVFETSALIRVEHMGLSQERKRVAKRSPTMNSKNGNEGEECPDEECI